MTLLMSANPLMGATLMTSTGPNDLLILPAKLLGIQHMTVGDKDIQSIVITLSTWKGVRINYICG